MNPAHYDYETLADLAEGLLEDDMAASVSEHLDTCAPCRERAADLADVSRLLAEAPVPSMPAELASRIDSAIAAESLNNATVVSLERRRGRRHWRVLSAAAATVIVLGGGVMIGTMALDGAGDHETSGNAPVSDSNDRGGAGEAPTPSGARPERSALVAPEGRDSPGKARYQVSRSGTDYRAATLDRQVKGRLDGGAGTRSAGRPPEPGLTECVDKITQGKVPTLVDTAKYEGAPATVIAAPGAAPGGLDVWAVDCSPRDPKVLKHLATTRRG